MMETCSGWMPVDFAGAKGESPFVSLPSVVSCTVTGTMCPKESAAQSVKVQSLFHPICLYSAGIFLFACSMEMSKQSFCSSEVCRFLCNSVYFYIFAVPECAVMFFAVLLWLWHFLDMVSAFLDKWYKKLFLISAQTFRQASPELLLWPWEKFPLLCNLLLALFS